MTIELRAIKEGDVVKLQDRDGNMINAEAHYALPMGDRMYVLAFGARIDFARHTAAGWQRASGITVVGHQAAFDFEGA